MPTAPDDASALAAFAAAVARARETGGALNIIGGGTKAFYGREPVGEPLSVGEFSGIIEYEPAELVVTARAGTRLDELQSVLAEQQQMLAFEPPAFGPTSTVGGVIAAGLSGPRRPYAGAVRDSVLGVEVMTGGGEVLRFGGQVMKNVAGYDVSRLMTGSMGTLGLILVVSLKVLPQPETERTVLWRCDAAAAARRMIGIAREPWPVSAMAYTDDELRVRLAGNNETIDEAVGALQPDADGDNADWKALNDQRLPFFLSSDPLWRVSVPPAAPRIDVPGAWLCDWGGALRWLSSDAPAGRIREAARVAGGHATCFRGGDEPFAPLDRASFEIHRRLKHVFDPDRVFNPGRLYADL